MRSTTGWTPTGSRVRLARDGAPLLLAVGRLVEKKGFDRLVEACALLRDRGVAFRCAIVGEDGSAGPALRAQVEALGLGEHVQLHAAVAQDRLREIYRDASAFALPVSFAPRWLRARLRGPGATPRRGA